MSFRWLWMSSRMMGTHSLQGREEQTHEDPLATSKACSTYSPLPFQQTHRGHSSSPGLCIRRRGLSLQILLFRLPSLLGHCLLCCGGRGWRGCTVTLGKGEKNRDVLEEAHFEIYITQWHSFAVLGFTCGEGHGCP